MEKLLRKVVWFFVEQPKKAALVTGISALLLLGVTGYTFKVYRAHSNLRAALQLQPGSMSSAMFRKAVQDASARALAGHALQPLLCAKAQTVVQGGIPFLLSTLDPAVYARKSGKKEEGSAGATAPAAAAAAAAGAATAPSSPTAALLSSAGANAGGGAGGKELGKKPDAFASLPSELVVSDLFGTHRVLLNKFFVIPNHLVLITKEFQSQEAPLSRADLRALWTCVSKLDGLAFHNSGWESGASQPRRHSQFISFQDLQSSYGRVWAEAAGKVAAQLGVDRDTIRLPLDAAILAHQKREGFLHYPGLPFRLPELPFAHAVCMLGGDILVQGADLAAQRLHGFYAEALSAACRDAVLLGLAEDGEGRAGAEEASMSMHRQSLRAQLQQSCVSSPFTAEELQAMSAPGSTATAFSPRFVPSHNVLVTPTWLMVVPRASPEWTLRVPGQGAASDAVQEVKGDVNSLGYAGLLLARESQMPALLWTEPAASAGPASPPATGTAASAAEQGWEALESPPSAQASIAGGACAVPATGPLAALTACGFPVVPRLRCSAESSILAAAAAGGGTGRASFGEQSDSNAAAVV